MRWWSQRESRHVVTRRHVRTYGTHGVTVHVYLERGKVWCEWRDARGKRKTKSWPASLEHEAKKWAQEYADERKRLAPIAGPIPTVAQLWEKYRAAKAHAWRPKTAKLYAEWAATLVVIRKPVSEITHEDVDGFREHRRGRGIAHSSIQRAIGFLRQMLNFAQGRKIVGVNPLATYRYQIPKDERGKRPAEYSRAELLRIAAVLDWPTQWRARNVIRLCASYGARINAILHLRWEDVSFDAGTVTFQAKWDKTAETFTRPMTPVAKAALLESYQHRNEGGWVFWSRYRPATVMHYNGLWWHLRQAEDRAGVTHIPKRAFHGLRRMVVGDIGDLSTAAQWLKQSTLAVTNQYMRVRPENLERARHQLEEKEAADA